MLFRPADTRKDIRTQRETEGQYYNNHSTYYNKSEIYKSKQNISTRDNMAVTITYLF